MGARGDPGEEYKTEGDSEAEQVDSVLRPYAYKVRLHDWNRFSLSLA